MKKYIQVRLHGRGGQGAVTAAELIAKAAFYEGKYSQAFPNFGVERRGAPVEAFVRISDEPIRIQSQIYEPDYLIVQDPTLLNLVPDVLEGIKKKTVIIVNSEKNNWPKLDLLKLYTVPVTDFAREILGRDITNTGMITAFALITKLVQFDALEKAVKDHFKYKPELIKKNIELMKQIQNYLIENKPKKK